MPCFDHGTSNFYMAMALNRLWFDCIKLFNRYFPSTRAQPPTVEEPGPGKSIERVKCTIHMSPKSLGKKSSTTSTVMAQNTSYKY